MENSKYKFTTLGDKSVSNGNRKIKATQSSLQGMRASAEKFIKSVNEMASDAKKSVIDRLAEKGITLHSVEIPDAEEVE